MFLKQTCEASLSNTAVPVGWLKQPVFLESGALHLVYVFILVIQFFGQYLSAYALKYFVDHAGEESGMRIVVVIAIAVVSAAAIAVPVWIGFYIAIDITTCVEVIVRSMIPVRPAMMIVVVVIIPIIIMGECRSNDSASYE